MKTETRFRELRAHDRRLTGTVMRYGDEAEIPGIGRERSDLLAPRRGTRSRSMTCMTVPASYAPRPGTFTTRCWRWSANVMHEPDLIVASTSAARPTV